MNIFRIMGDLCHYTAIITIFAKIIASKSCMGISGRCILVQFVVLKTAFLQYFVMNVCRIKDCHIYLQTNIFLRSQILFLLVFLTRYMDVFTHFISMYNTSIKIFFIISTTANIYLVFVKYAGTISSDMDTFRYK